MKRYLTHKRYKEISSKVKECYSIYPSCDCASNSVDIMLYSDPSNVRKGHSVPLKFCALRRTYVFDVYKNKYRFNKIIRFNFIINHSEIVDSAYSSKKIDGKVVNEVNFGDVERQIEKLNKSVYNIRTYTPRYLLMKQFTNKEPLLAKKRKSFDDEMLKSSCTSASDEDEYGNVRFDRSDKIAKSSTTLIGLLNKEVRSCDSILKPILKCMSESTSKSKRKNSIRRVSFGSVQFSF